MKMKLITSLSMFLVSWGLVAATISRPLLFSDDLTTLSAWKAQGSVGVVSHRESIDQHRDGTRSLKVDYEFNDSGGYLILRRHLGQELPEDYQARFQIRGEGQTGQFEFKFFDPSGQNVFWKRFESIEFPINWKTIQLERADIAFAWGPDALTPLKRAEDVELVIVSDRAIRGTVWLKGFELQDQTYRETPIIQHASGSYLIDFKKERKIGAIWIDWGGENQIEPIHPSPTPSPSSTPSPSPNRAPSSQASPVVAPLPSPSGTRPSTIPSILPTPSPSRLQRAPKPSPTPSTSASPPISPTPSPSRSQRAPKPSPTPSPSASPSISPTPSPSRLQRTLKPSPTPSPSATPSISPTPSPSRLQRALKPSPTPSPFASPPLTLASPKVSLAPSATPSETPAPSQPLPSATPSASPSRARPSPPATQKAIPELIQIERSTDGTHWEVISEVDQAGGKTTYVRIPYEAAHPGDQAPKLRYIRITPLDPKTGAKTLETLPIAGIRTTSAETARDRFSFLRSVATDRPRGAYPRYFYGEQPYWTTVPAPLAANHSQSQWGGTFALPAILNQDGMIEFGPASVSLEPIVRVGDKLVTWAESTQQTESLEKGYLPFPSSTWKTSELELTTTAFSRPIHTQPVIFVRYRITNTSKQAQKLSLNTLIRPIPVNPPWQYEPRSKWMTQGSTQIEFDGKRVVTRRPDSDLAHAVIPLIHSGGGSPRFGAKPFASGPIYDDLASGTLPSSRVALDPDNYPTGVLQFSSFDEPLAPGATREVFLATLAFNTREVSTSELESRVAEILKISGEFELVTAKSEWETKLNWVRITGPEQMTRALDTRKTAISQILANRKGPALEPGPRRYATAWIRDGAVMASALLQNGIEAPAREFALWFSKFQREDGFIPCCVTDDKLEPNYIEYDSNGQFLFLIAEIYRFTRDQEFVLSLWPKIEMAVQFIEKLRSESMTDSYKNESEKRLFYGIIPKSVSHEAYLGNPVHSYWDDYWTLRGLNDATWLANEMRKDSKLKQWKKLSEDFSDSLFTSIRKVIEEKKIQHIPASGEMLESDATSTAPGLNLIGEKDPFPPGAVRQTITDFWQKLTDRIDGNSKNLNYTAYELRMIEALIRLGDREKASQVLNFFLQDQRPVGWNQWPEITWKDPSLPSGIGDLPHTWIAAEYLRGIRSAFAYEREDDRSLFIADGIPTAWLNSTAPIQVANFPTTYGAVNYTLETTPIGMINNGVFKTLFGEEKLINLRFFGEFRKSPSRIYFRPHTECKIRSVSSQKRYQLDPSGNWMSFKSNEFEAAIRIECPGSKF